MKLLLQAGIHLIKKVITFVIYGRSVQVFKACTLFYFFSAEFFFSQIFLRGKVLSHRFHRFTWFFFIGFHGWIGGILAYRITHGFSRNFGRWSMARALYMLLLFWSRRFRRWRRFFFVGGFCPTDFTDIHRFSMESLVNLFVQSQGVSATTGQVASAKIRE